MQKKKKDKKKDKKDVKEEKKGGKKKAVKEEGEKWKWWEEERQDDGTKWKFLEHKGPVFAPPYEPLPDHVGFYYGGKRVSTHGGGFALFGAGCRSVLETTDGTCRRAVKNQVFNNLAPVLSGDIVDVLEIVKICIFLLRR